MGRHRPMDSDHTAVHIARKGKTMSRYIDADALIEKNMWEVAVKDMFHLTEWVKVVSVVSIDEAPGIDIVRCQDCRKSHIDGKTTHYLWCTEWGRSTDTFGYCERGEREGE